MGYDVFISYSDKDRLIVTGLCAFLEKKGIRCFVAYRNIPHGAVWAGAITDAIQNCKIMITVFTENFNSSRQVEKEIELASNAGKVILVFRLTDVPYNNVKKYYLQNINWIDAFPFPENYFESVSQSVTRLLETDRTIFPADKQSQQNVKPFYNGKKTKQLIAFLISITVIGLFSILLTHKFTEPQKRVFDIKLLAENTIRENCIGYIPFRCLVIIMDVKSGLVLDLLEAEGLTKDYFKGGVEYLPIQIKHHTEMPYKSFFFEPIDNGFCFAPISLLAALDDNRLDLRDTVSVSFGRMEYHNRVMYDRDQEWSDSIKIFTLKEVLIKRSFVGLAKAIIRAYNDNQKDYYNKLKEMCVGQPYNSEIGKDSINGPLAFNIIGYGIRLSIVQMLTVYNAIANEGKMIRPVFNENIEKSQTICSEIASKESISKMQHLLQEINTKNNGSNTEIAGISSLNKNFTFYPEFNYQFNFYGYFPAQNPEYSCAVILEKDSIESNENLALNIANKISSEIMNASHKTK
ncbi:MAG: TIR domain-containing protein [Bacteroidota bacterium]